jgi:serine/threonine protein kinase
VANSAEIGRGGFGVVYRADEVELGREVAVKVLTGELDDRTRTRFERERRAMGALSSHPNIITIFRSGKAETGELYLVMEYLPGGSLADRLRAHGPVGWQNMLRFGVELCGALESAHRAGVLHRDVKPGNIMLDGLGRCQLGDFGIARLDGGPETRSSVITASVAHAPPEVIAGDRPDERSDVYSLASTLYELVSGGPAFSRDTDESMIPMFNRIVNESAPDLRMRGVPGQVAAVLEKAMSKSRDDRYGTAEEFGMALVAAQRANGLDETKLWITGQPQPQPQASAQPDPSWPAPAAQVAPQTQTAYVPPPQASSVAAPVHAPPPGPPSTGFGSTGLGSTGPDPTGSGSGRSSMNPLIFIGAFVVVLLVFFGIVGVLTGGSDGENTTEAAQNLVDGIDEADGPTTDTSPTTESTTATTDPAGETPSTESASSESTTPESTTPDSTTPDSTSPDSTGTGAGTTGRPAYLAGLPELPELADPYVEYRTISDPDSAFIVKVPVEWSDELPTDGQVLASPDNNAALADQVISGVVVSGTQGIGVWDADFFLDALLEGLGDADAPCDEVLREPYDDGLFDGLLYAESCSGGDLLVVDLLVANPERDAVIFIGVQMTDERDFAAFDRIIDSFVLLDPAKLPDVD